MLKRLKNESKGFTIIEVMIVLAIAGLIMLIIFLAVPALQRNSRNTQRRNDASHVMGLVTEYENNNNGAAPTAGLTVKGTAKAVDMSKETMSIMNPPTATTDIAMADASTTYTAPGTPKVDTLFPYMGATCNNNAVTGGSSTRNVVVVFYTEPGTTFQCISG